MLIRGIAKCCAGLATLALVVTSPSYAEMPGGDSNQCITMMRECLAGAAFERSSCLYSVATHPFCEETELGKLAYKRWSMSSGHDADQDAPPSLLGPQLLDQSCIVEFDERLREAMSSPSLDTDIVRGLYSSLDGCRTDRELQLDLGRP